jgi:hypothetical protein
MMAGWGSDMGQQHPACMSETTEYTLQITGSPALERSLREQAKQTGVAFQIESVETLEDPARLGFKLSKAVAIVTIISGVLTSADLASKLYEAIEDSGSELTTLQTPTQRLEVRLPKGKKLTPEQQKDLLEFIGAMMK